MSEYGHFTEEQKRTANAVDLEEFLLRQGETLLSSGREKRLGSNHSITVRGNEWYDHGTEKGGYAIDFIKYHYGYSFPKAVSMLLGGEQGEVYKRAEKKEKPKKPFELPPQNKDMRRAFAYLLKERGLEKDIVSFFAKEHLIYESCEKSEDGTKEYHNAVFVGFDENGKPKHANKRGIYTEGKSFKGNIESSNPEYSFHYKGISERLYVFEAPIDLLSFISMYKDSDWQKHSYVALCGLSFQTVLKQLELNSNLGHVVLCMDNDEAGNKACQKFEKLLLEKNLDVSRLAPTLKDFNEDLKVQKELIKESREAKLPEIVLKNDKETNPHAEQESQDVEQIKVSQTVISEEKPKSNEKGEKDMAVKNEQEQVLQKKKEEVLKDSPMRFYVSSNKGRTHKPNPTRKVEEIKDEKTVEAEKEGKWIELPCSKEELQKVFDELGITAETGYTITAYKGEIEGLGEHIEPDASLDELNYFATRLSELEKENPENIKTVQAAVSQKEHTENLKDLINLTYNLKCYDLNENIQNPAELAVETAKERNSSQVPNLETKEGYEQAETLGCNVAKQEHGKFTDYGYLKPTEVEFKEQYKGTYRNIPKDIRIDPLYKQKHPEYKKEPLEKQISRAKEKQEKQKGTENVREEPSKSKDIKVEVTPER